MEPDREHFRVEVELDSFRETGYFSTLRIYPHILLRENKMIATAGADRLQEGMRGAFGKAVSLAARVQRDQVLMEAFVKKEHLEVAKKALHGAAVKLPITPTIKVIKLKPASVKA